MSANDPDGGTPAPDAGVPDEPPPSDGGVENPEPDGGSTDTGTTSDGGTDTGSNPDAGTDSGTDSGSSPDAGSDGGTDSGSSPDAGSDGGTDSGSNPDAGSDGGTDTGSSADGGTDGGTDTSSTADGGTDGGTDTSSTADGGIDGGTDGGDAPEPEPEPEPDGGFTGGDGGVPDTSTETGEIDGGVDEGICLPDAGGGSFTYPTPVQPNGGTATELSGSAPAPCDTAGVNISTVGDTIWSVINWGWEIKNDEATVTHGPVFKIINGNKHKHIATLDETCHLGCSWQEVIGLDTKLALGGDRRWISNTRWERNIGLKAETITGDYNSHTQADKEVDVTVKSTDSNPTLTEEQAKEHEVIARKIVDQFKTRMTDTRKSVVQKVAESKIMFKDYTRDYKSYTATIEKLSGEFHNYCGKLSSLKEQVKQYQIKTEKFFKLIASASIKLQAAKFDAKAKSKWSYVAKALSEFKGDIKLGG